MADSLYFKADRSITKHTGTELSLIIPKGGGQTHRFPQWWDRKNIIQYIKCAIFKVELSDGNTVRLVVPIEKEGVSLDIRHDGEGNFSFPAHQRIERVAVVDAVNTTLLHEYQFPSISSGRILKRIVADFLLLQQLLLARCQSLVTLQQMKQMRRPIPPLFQVTLLP